MKIFKSQYFILLLLEFLVILVFSGVQKTKSEGLKAMLANPVANMQLTTAREVRRYQMDKDKTLGKPGYAEILVIYEPIDNNTQGDVYDEIVGNIENSGWERDSYSAERDDYYSGALPYYKTSVSKGRLDIGVSTASESSNVTLSIVAY